jgi:predicted phage terminase large subunit-like protein
MAALVIPSLDEIDAQLAAKELRTFIEMAWPVVEPGTPYKSGWHIDAICHYLEACTNGELRKLIINVPPRTMKSRSVSVFWPAWMWLTRPETRWLFASYSNDLATEHSVECRAVIESEGGRERAGTLMERVGYQGLLRLVGQSWGIAKDQNLKTRFQNTERGYRLATSVTSKVTGFGGDIIVADDPHNALEADSDVERPKVIKWWDRAITSRMNDPKTGVRVVVMQRLHEEDLTGHLMARERDYTLLCLPMEYEPNHPFVWPDDERTEAGELLWPEHIGPNEVVELKEMGDYAYAGQYQQRPAPEAGGIFQTAWWRYYPKQWLEFEPDYECDSTWLGWQGPHFTKLWQSWDTALKEKTSNDFTVGQLWGQFGADRYLLRQVRGRWSLVEAKDQMGWLTGWAAERFPRLRSHSIFVENTAMGPELIAAVRRDLQGVVPVRADRDKVSRAQAVTPQIRAGNVFVPGAFNDENSGPHPSTTPDWVLGLISECASFPNAAHDDQVDALTQALNPERWPREGKSKRDDNAWGKGKTITGGMTPDDV